MLLIAFILMICVLNSNTSRGMAVGLPRVRELAPLTDRRIAALFGFESINGALADAILLLWW
jgi:hypothetical protein